MHQFQHVYKIFGHIVNIVHQLKGINYLFAPSVDTILYKCDTGPGLTCILFTEMKLLFLNFLLDNSPFKKHQW